MVLWAVKIPTLPLRAIINRNGVRALISFFLPPVTEAINPLRNVFIRFLSFLFFWSMAAHLHPSSSVWLYMEVGTGGWVEARGGGKTMGKGEGGSLLQGPGEITRAVLLLLFVLPRLRLESASKVVIARKEREPLPL